MAASFLKGLAGLRKHWRWLAVSVLVVGSIVHSCGQCASCTSQPCTWINTGLALLLSPIETDQNALPYNSDKATTYLTIPPSTKNTSKTSSKDYASGIPKKSATFIAENTDQKHSVLTITLASSTTPSTIYSCTDRTKELIHILHLHSRIYGLMDSQQLANLISTQQLTQHDIALKKLLDPKQQIITCAWTTMESPRGSNQNT